MPRLTAASAMRYLMRDRTKYNIAKTIDVQPIMIDRYLKGTKMKAPTAKRMKLAFDIDITDIYSPGRKEK